ncbi:MAG: SDR family oxidoreductase [Thermodesulfovibrionales bacterium]|nr:SDR family oxidoreductase [Thermodesulfovibrionales bacterium]
MKQLFENKLALVTGSSRGIGKAIARNLAYKGANIVVNYSKEGGSSEKQAQELCEEIERIGNKSLLIKADISSKNEVKSMFEKIDETFGSLDFLILNAAKAPFKPIEKLFERDLKMLIEVNLLGNIFCIQQAIPFLEKSHGKIVYISSLGSRFFNPSYPLGIMKSAMESLVRDLSCSLSNKSISVNAVCGGIVKTDSFKILRQLWEGVDRIPDDLIVDPDEIAETVSFLCSDASRGIRGQTIIVDRGMSNRLNYF